MVARCLERSRSPSSEPDLAVTLSLVSVGSTVDWVSRGTWLFLASLEPKF